METQKIYRESKLLELLVELSALGHKTKDILVIYAPEPNSAGTRHPSWIVCWEPGA